MVNFDPPAKKALSDAELFKILSEIPADSEGMERAANLMGEQERLREEDERNYQRWLEDLKSDGSDQARAALEAELEPAPTAPVAIVTEAAVADVDDAEPAARTAETAAQITNQISFESLVTGSQPIAVEAESTSPTGAKLAGFDASPLQLPLALLLAILISSTPASLDSIIGLGGGALLGGFGFLLASRGGPTDLGAIFTVSFGVIAGRLMFAAVAIFSLVWGLSAAQGLSWGAFARRAGLSADLIAYAVPAIAAVAIALGLFASRWLRYLILLTGLGALGLLITTGAFSPAKLSSANLASVSVEIWPWLAAGFALGFIAQSSAVSLPRNLQFAFAPMFAAAAGAAGFLAIGLTVAADARIAVAAFSVLAFSYFVASSAVIAARASAINASWVVIGLLTAPVLILLPIEAGVGFAAMAVFAALGIAAADGALRNLPLHIASTRRSFGFYGAASISALTSWLIATAASISVAIVLGLTDLDFGLVGAPTGLTAPALLAVALGSGFLLGLLRISAVRNREVDQQSASGNQPLQNLLGL